MLDALLTLLTSFHLLAMVLLGVVAGLAFGVVPGLGGKLAIVAMLPFVFAMDVMTGCVFVLSLHAVVHTGGAVPTILFGVPGTAPSTAVVADGHAMTRKGEAGRALSAAFLASAIGGVLGAVFLAAFIPLGTTLLNYASYPEIFVLTLAGISISAVLGGDAPLKGFALGALGLALASIGAHETYGTFRFTLGQPFLWEGLDLIAAVISLYAIPEMIELLRDDGRKTASANRSGARGRYIVAGFRDMLAHRWLTVRTSFIGALFGMLPGVGGDAAAWFCYGHAAQTSKHPERFGKGAIDGIIGPEAANNAKEGGALVPTLLLGIPGSSGMALLLVALIPLGLQPGPSLFSEQIELVWLMVWALVLSNLIASAVLLAGTGIFSRLSSISSVHVAPYVMLFSLIAVFLSTHEWRYILLVAGFGVLGYAFRRQGWPRAPFVIAFILGHAAEQALLKSWLLWGPAFVLRPGVLILSGILLAAVFYTLLRRRRSARTGEA